MKRLTSCIMRNMRSPYLWLAVLVAGGGVLVATIFAVEAGQNGFGNGVRAAGPWLGGLAGIAVAALTAMYVAATQDMAKATRELAEETKKQREEATAPLVSVYLDFQRWLLFVTVENTGGGIARNVRVTFQPPIPSRAGPISELPTTTYCIPVLRPREKFPQLIDAAPAFFADRGRPTIFKATVTYDDFSGNAKEPLHYPLNTSVYEGMLGPTKDMADLVKEVEQIRRRLEGITDLSSLHIKMPRDVEREYQEALKKMEETRTEKHSDPSEQEQAEP